MASADPSLPFPPSYDGSSTEAGEEVSQGKMRNLHPIPRRIYTHSFRMTIGLWNPMFPRPEVAASYAVPVRRAGTLPTASFRFHLAMDTLAVQLTIPVIGARRGLSPRVIWQAPRLPEQRCRATHHAWRTSGKGRPLTVPYHTNPHAGLPQGHFRWARTWRFVEVRDRLGPHVCAPASA
jgi:hypothetical protein